MHKTGLSASYATQQFVIFFGEAQFPPTELMC
jgi:hypothetical protein